MKVLHIVRNIPVKSLQGNPVILDLLTNLKKIGIENKILFPAEYIPKVPFLNKRAIVFSELKGSYTINEFKLLFVNFIRIPGKNAFFLSQYYFNKASIDDFANGFDCIHAHYIQPDGIIAHTLSQRKAIPYIVTVRQGDVDRIRLLKKTNPTFSLLEKVLRASSSIISVNPNIAMFIKDLFNLDSVVIPHGVDGNLIEKYTSSNDAVKFIVSAQFIKRKNIDWVVNSLNELSKQSLNNYQLTIVGRGELEYDIRKLAANNSNIVFMPWMNKDALMEEFKRSDVFVMVSDNETFGMVYIEAAAKNCLVIGKKNTGVDGYFQNEVNAFFVSDQEELTQLLKNILQGHVDIKKISEAGVNLVERSMTWEVVSEKYLGIYKRAI